MEKEREIYEEEVIDLGGLFRALIKNILIIILAAVIGALLGILAPQITKTPTYTSSGQLSAVAGLAKEDIISLIQSRDVAEKAAETINANGSEQISYDYIQNKISVSYPTSSNFITISVKDEDPYLAWDIADAVINAAVERVNSHIGSTAVTILKNAEVPASADGSGFKRNAMYGGAIGFLISVIVVSALYINDKKIRSTDDIKNHLGLNIIGVLPVYGSEEDIKKINRRKSSASYDEQEEEEN